MCVCVCVRVCMCVCVCVCVCMCSYGVNRLYYTGTVLYMQHTKCTNTSIYTCIQIKMDWRYNIAAYYRQIHTNNLTQTEGKTLQHNYNNLYNHTTALTERAELKLAYFYLKFQWLKNWYEVEWTKSTQTVRVQQVVFQIVVLLFQLLHTIKCTS